MITLDKPLMVGGYAEYPYSEQLAAEFSFYSRFDEHVKVWKKVDDKIWLPRGSCPLGDVDVREEGEAIDCKNLFVPRHDDQAKVVSVASKRLAAGESFILQAPTGYGKTYVGCALAALLRRRTCVVTTKSDILDQWANAGKAVMGLEDKDIGIWRANQQPLPEHKLVISLVHSVLKGPERYGTQAYKGFGLLLIDEVHRMAAEEFSEAMWWFPAKLRMGMSATPYRKDGKDPVFLSHIGPIKVVAQQDVLKPKIIVKATQWKVPRVWRGGEYVKLPHEPGRTMQLSNSMAEDVARNDIICQFVGQAYEKGRSTIIFCDTLKHLANLRQHLIKVTPILPNDIGWYVGLGSDVYQGNQAQQKAQREKAKVKPVILATFAMASEATDIPWLDTCVLAAPRSDVIQIVGRIRREYEGKKTPVVFDLVDVDSPILANYHKARMKWYRSIGAEIAIY